MNIFGTPVYGFSRPVVPASPVRRSGEASFLVLRGCRLQNSAVNPFSLSDQHHLRAAEGWLELGDHLAANEELENITPQLRAHPAVLELRWQIYAKELKWDACRDIADAITKQDPARMWGWLHLAYSTRRATSGSVDSAKDILLNVADRFPRVWEIPFNLACYFSVTGAFDEAQSWLKKAMAIDDKTVQKAAIDDPDLKPLWDSMSGTLWKKSE